MTTDWAAGTIGPGCEHCQGRIVWLDTVKIGTVSLPIAIGLLAMMYLVLAKVKDNRIGEVAGDRRSTTLSLLLHWAVGRR